MAISMWPPGLLQGERIARRQRFVSIRDNSNPGSMAPMVKDLPYGTWRIRIAAPGFNGVERVVHLDQPEVSVRTQLQVAEECGHPEPQISGTVTPPPSGRDLWVKVVPLRGIGDEEARVDPDGEFHVAARMNGDYFLLLADETRHL